MPDEEEQLKGKKAAKTIALMTAQIQRGKMIEEVANAVFEDRQPKEIITERVSVKTELMENLGYMLETQIIEGDDDVIIARKPVDTTQIIQG